MKKIFLLPLCILVCAGIALAQTGVRKRTPGPSKTVKVFMINYPEKAGSPPLFFDPWLHRAYFPGRRCLGAISFAMSPDAPGVKAPDNMSGYFCAPCHNGKTMPDGVKVFEACSKKLTAEDGKRCERCHSLGKKVKREYDFNQFTGKLPKERFGNGIDWEKAESEGLIKPVDFLEGVSIKRPALAIQKDFLIEAKMEGMPEIVFSHKKHTVWSGCELCHPEIFVGVKKGTTKYSMVEIFEGKYCGPCHGTVSFPLLDCQRCHTKLVQ